MNEVTNLLKSHRSIRKFTSEPVSDELINEIILCGQAAATSSNIQATTVIRVRDSGKREKLAELAGGQGYVHRAGAFLVFCADLHRSQIACEMQSGSFSEGMTEHFMIATVDVALMAQNCVVAAESLGLGICYIGGIRNNPQAVSELLDLPDQVYPLFGLCLGYPDQDPDVKPRLPLSVVLKEDSYQDAGDVAGIKIYDEQIRSYYKSRTGGKKDSCWSEEMKALVGKESRPHMREFLRKRGFLMK
ncbi:MAG: oxygen-insensitive NADPH nitroreductase [Gammaproteobacteria bacterium]|nr:MAG: oxygen-insensitive NADPH nitroreductase [Gammaproteobacteria bacterium]